MKIRHAVLMVSGLALAILGVAAPAGARVAAGTEHFVALSNNPNAHKYTLAARGPIHAAGTDVQVSGTKDKFKFANGSLLVKHTPTKHHTRRDKKTCLFEYTESGSYTVTGGTGAYKGASGHGHYAVDVLGVGCSQKNPPKPFQLTLRASGPLTP
jgi:hypothetical protein